MGKGKGKCKGKGKGKFARGLGKKIEATNMRGGENIKHHATIYTPAKKFKIFTDNNLYKQ